MSSLARQPSSQGRNCQMTKAAFTQNLNYIQLKYNSDYHTCIPFNFIQLCFSSHLQKHK